MRKIIKHADGTYAIYGGISKAKEWQRKHFEDNKQKKLVKEVDEICASNT